MKYIALRVEDGIHKRLSRKAGSRGLQKLAVHALESYLSNNEGSKADLVLGGLTDKQQDLVLEIVRLIERSNPDMEDVLRAVVEMAKHRRR